MRLDFVFPSITCGIIESEKVKWGKMEKKLSLTVFLTRAKRVTSFALLQDCPK